MLFILVSELLHDVVQYWQISALAVRTYVFTWIDTVISNYPIWHLKLCMIFFVFHIFLRCIRFFFDGAENAKQILSEIDAFWTNNRFHLFRIAEILILPMKDNQSSWIKNTSLIFIVEKKLGVLLLDEFAVVNFM